MAEWPLNSNSDYFVVQYQEVVGPESPSVYTFDEENGAVATLVYDIDATEITTFSPLQIPLALLGWASYTPGASGGSGANKLSRHLPVSITSAPWLYAKKVTSCRGRMASIWTNAAKIATRNATNLPAKVLRLDYLSPGTEGNTSYQGANPKVVYLSTAVYPTWRCTVLFEARVYDIWDDSQITREYERYTSVELEPGLESIQRPQGNYKYAQGPPGVPGNPFPQQTIARSQKASYVFTWHQVPHAAIFSNNYVLSNNLLAGLGCVNNAAWPTVAIGVVNPNGQQIQPGTVLPWLLPNQVGAVPFTVPVGQFATGTLLLTAIKVKRHQYAVPQQFTGSGTNSSSPLCWDVSFYMTLFDPPIDPTIPVTPASPQWRGHNLVPAFTNDANGNYYYYLATTTGGLPTTQPPLLPAAGRTIYAPYNFDYLWLPL